MQPCRAVIRLDAIRGNAALLRAKAAGAKLCAVVKADAYGHGGAMVCQALTGVADCFAVALVEEGVRLRLAGVSADILVLVPPLSEEEAVRAALYGLTVSVGDGQDIALVSRALAGRGLTVRVHLQVNTGMNRFGFEEAPFAALCGEGLPPCMRAEGIYSHFYAPHDAAVTREQFSRFCAFRARAEQAYGIGVVRGQHVGKELKKIPEGVGRGQRAENRIIDEIFRMGQTGHRKGVGAEVAVHVRAARSHVRHAAGNGNGIERGQQNKNQIRRPETGRRGKRRHNKIFRGMRHRDSLALPGEAGEI